MFTLLTLAIMVALIAIGIRKFPQSYIAAAVVTILNIIIRSYAPGAGPFILMPVLIIGTFFSFGSVISKRAQSAASNHSKSNTSKKSFDVNEVFKILIIVTIVVVFAFFAQALSGFNS